MTKEDLERDIEEAARSGNYKYLVLRKQEWMAVHLREISYFLEPLLPLVVNSGSLFCVEDLKPCPESDTQSDRLHVFSRIDPDTGEPAIKFVEDSRGACVPLTRIRTSAVRSIYEKMMEFVYKSDLPVYNPESHTGFWSSFTIRVNSVGKSMLVIEVYSLDPQEKSLKPELLNNLREYLQKNEENLLFVVLKLHSLNSVKNSILYGTCLLSENINNLEFTIYTSRYCSWNLAGEEGFCENLIYLSKMEKHSWGLIQIGCLSTVSTITLAAACSHSVAFNVDGEVRDFIISDAKKNSVNLQIVAECTITSLNGALTQRLSHAENICVVMFDVRTQLKDKDLVDILRSCSKVNRILFAARFEDPALLRRLVLCCSDHGGDSESFIVTKAVPVNLSPFNQNQIIIFVLERQSLVGKTLPNSMYNKDRVTEFLWGRKCKYIDAPYKDDDRYFRLIPEKTLLQSIFEMLQNGRPKSALEYEEQLKLKQECVWLQGQAVTALLWGVLPKIIKNGTPGFYFPLKALKAPKFENTLSFTLGAKPVKSENDPKKLIMKYGLIDDNDEITVPLKEIHSPWAKFMYEKTMKFIEDYGYPLYNTDNKSGFWKLFKIKVNPEGLIMVVIGVEVDPEPQEDAEAVISELELALNYSFRDDNLRSLILKVYLGETIQYKIVAGIEFMHEEVPPFKMFNYYGNMPWMSSNGALEIARVVVDMIAVDSTWSVVQFGRTHDAMSLYIAKCCQVLHVVHDDKETKRCLTSNCQLNLTNQLIMYHENRKGKDFMDIIQYNSSNVCCVIPDFSYYKKNVNANFLKNMPNVKKIICISKLTDPVFINEIVSLCDGVQSENEAFIIKEVVPVDTSPHDNVIKTVTLLVHQSLVKHEVESNPIFRKNDLQEFYSKSISEKHTFLTEVCNLMKPCISNNPTRFKFFQSLNPYSIHKDFTSVTRGKSQMTTNEQIKMLKEGSTSEIEESDANHEYRNSVAKEIEETIKKQDFETLVLLKQKWMSLHLKIICNFLGPLIPLLLKNTNPSNLFHIGDLKPCLATNSSSDRLHVFSRVNSVSKEPELKFVVDSHGKFFQLTQSMILNETIKLIYEKMVNLINTSNLTLFNPETCIGTLHSLLIRVDGEGQSFVEIKIFLPAAIIKDVTVSSLKTLLHDFFNEENILLSIMLRIQYTDSEEIETLFGMAVFFESGSNLQLTGSDITIDWHPAGIEGLRRTLIKLSNVKKKTCTFVHIGCLSPVITIGLATLSMYSVVLNVDAYTREHLVVAANQNMILLEATQENSAEALTRSLTEKLSDCERVCLVVFNSKLGMKDEQFADILVQHRKVERILFVSLFDDLSHLSKIVACCYKQDEEDKTFLITKMVPVDMGPYEHNELVVCVLERRHAMLSNILPNVKYSAEKTTAYLQNILPEESSALVSEQVLLTNIIGMLQRGGPASVKEYKMQIKWKHDLLWLYGKAFCCLLRELIPCTTKTRIQTPGFLFPMKPLKPCVFKETVCSLLYVDCTVCKDGDTTPFSMRFGHNHDQNGGFTVPLNEIHSPGISYIYELMVRFIEQSGYELYNPATDTGVWINFKIRLNSKAKALLHIFVKPRLELIDLLKEYFKPHEDLFESLVLKFLENESGLEKEVIIMGKECLTEYIDGFKLNLCEPMSWFDPNGILQLSKTVIDLSCVDHTWTGIQLGSKYDLGYSIAKNCGELHVLCKTERMKNLIWNNAKQNKITNIRPYTMVASLINFTRDSDKVCLFIPDTTLLQTTANLDVLIAKPNIKKIVCISKFTDPLLVNLVVTLCNSENGFLLKEAIPVDMSPHDNCVNVVLLLVRKSFKAYKAEGNKDFSVMELRKYSIMSTSQKHTLIASKIDNLTRSFAEFQDEKRQFDRCLSFDWTTYESDKQTLIKEVEEAGNPSVMEVVLDEVNDDVKGDPGCDQEDNSDKQTLIKEIEAGNPSVMEVVHHEVTDDVNGDAGCDQEGKISTDQVNENNPSSSELQLLSLIADKGLVLPDNIAEEIEKVLSSQGIKTPKLDKKLVPVKTLNEDIVSMIHTGGPKTIEEYHKQLRWKHECTWLQAKAFCSIIARSLPRLVKLRTQGFLFNINGVKACPFRKTVSEALCVKSEVSRNDPDELVMRHRLSKENDTVLPVKSIYSEKVAELYNKMMVVIKSSGYPLHHPKKNTGYWKHFTIRVNSVGNSMLIVTVMSPSQNVGTQTIVSHIKLLLKMNFATSDVDSLVLEIISGFEYTPIVLHGELHLPEIVGNIEVKLCPHALWSNPYGILEVCRAIVNMASLDDTWAVIQLGQGYDVVHLYVAKHCGILHMQSLPMYRKHVLDNAKANLIKNITYSEDLTDILKSKELSSYSNICVIIPEFIDFDEYAVCLIKNEPKIKKIICVSEFTDPLFIDRIVSSCYDDQNSEKSFVIKDVTPVDMSPWDNLVKIVALLTRKYLVNVDHNQEFSEEESKELLSMTDTIKQHRLNQISDLIEPFVATHDEKSLYDQTLEFPRVSDYYNKHKDSSDENILKYIVSKYVKSNKFYSEIEKILTSDKPKTCDLYKNILSQKEAVATSLVGSLCDRLKPFQQFLFTGEKKNFCVVENLRPCSVIPTLSERIYVPLVKMNLNPESSACSSVYSDLYRRCQTDPGRRTFDLLMQFIQKSEYHIYNPSIGTGFWNNFIIRTDSTGNVYIVIVVQHRPSDHKTVYAQAFVSLLKQHLVDTRCPDYNVVSINLRVMERLSLKSEAGFGSLMATEVIDDFHLKFNFENILTYNRYGIKNLCNAIVELAELDKRWQVLQVGTECGIDVFHLAEKCNWVHYAERDKKFGIDIMADENGAKNITVWTLQNDRNKLQEILKNDFEDQKNICVVEYFTKDFEAPLNKENDEFLPSAALRKCTNVKKIIYVSELSNSSWESKLKICCLLKEDWEDPFVIKKFLTIDMSPFDNHIMLVCLLTRDTKFGVKSNPDYSPSKVRMFMDELIKDGYLVVRMKHKNIKSSALPLPPQRRDKGHNTHNTKKNEIDGEKGESFRISGETTKIPHVLRLKRSKSPVTDELHDSKVPRLNSSERIATTYSHIFGSLGSGAKQDQQRLIKPLKFSLENTSKAVRARQYKRTSVDTTNKNTTTSSDLNQNKIFFMETCFKTSEQCKQIATDTNFNTPIGISSSEQYIQYPTQALGVGGIQQYQQTPITSSFNVPTTVSSSEIQRQTAMNASYDIPMANGSSQQYNLHRTGTAFTALSRVDCVEQYKQMPSMVSFNIPTTTLNIPSTISSSKQMLPEGIIINLTESSTAINKEYVSLKTLPLRETVVSMSQNHKPETLSVGGNMLRRSRFDTMPVKNNHTKSNTFEKFSAKEILQGSTHGGKETLPDQETTIEESQYDTLKGVSVASNTGRKSRFDVHFKGSTAKRDIFEEVPIKKTMEKDAAHNVVKRYSLKEASLKSSALDDTERLPVEENTGNKSTYYEHFKESTKKINTFEEVPSKNTMEKEVAHNVVKRDRLKEASLKSSPRDDTERLRKEKNVKKSRYDEYFKASTAKSDTFQEMPIRKTMEKEAVHNVKSYTLKEASLKSAFHDDTERLPNEKNVKKSRYSEFFKASTAKSDTFEEVPVKITMKKEATHNVVKTQPIKEASLKNSTHDDTERLPVGRNVVQNSRVDGPFKETTAKRDIFEEVPIKKTMEKEATHNVAKRYSLKEATLKSSAHDKIGGNVEGKSKFAVHSKGRTAKNDMFEEVAIQNTMKKEAAHNVVKRCPLKEASLKDSVYDDNERLRYENSLLKSLLGLLFEETAAKSNTLEAAPVKKAEEYSQKILKEYSVEESAVQSSEYYIPQSLTLGKNNLQNSRIDRPFEANNKIKMEFLKNKSVAKESRCNVLTKRSPVMESVARSSRLNVSNETKYGLEDNSVKSLSQNSSDDMFQRGLFIENMAPIAKEHVLKRGVVEKIAQSNEYGSPARNLSEQSKRPSNFEYATTSSCERDLLYVGEERNRMKLVHEFGITEGVPEQVPEKLTLWRRGLHKTTQ